MSETECPVDERKSSSFNEELQSLLNRHSRENGSNTPDFILASYMQKCLDAFNESVRARDKWYSVKLTPGMSHFLREDE
jgi:hypothetical protein